jgi:peptidoglycan hydrolase-like protein with peptidoglycan-binding domain
MIKYKLGGISLKKTLVTVACALTLVVSLSVLPTNMKIGPFGVDVVSAATETSTPPPSTSTGSKSSTKTSSSSKLSTTLKLGSRGSAVKTLQTYLNTEGYNLKVDGSFGKLTLAAVKDYQGKNALEVDGKVGPKTRAKINAAIVAATPVPVVTLKLGSKGDAVKTLQTTLNSKGYKLAVDGSFGKLTLAAVKDYQGKNGLVVDGRVGPKTREKLYPTTTPTTPTTPDTDVPEVVTSASIVNDAAAFEAAISKNGRWIIATLKDLTFDKPLVLDGQFLNGKTNSATGLKTVQRKIGLYTQDADHNVTARFTLTAPKLTIMSSNASLEHGTFKGDIYVSVPDFQLKDARVEGNVYFTTKAAESTFKKDDASSISGKKELRLLEEVDAVTSASLVNENSAFETAISKTGKWIISVLNNLTFTKDLVLDGDFVNTKNPPATQRKIALYAQNADHATTARFTLTAPKLTINSPKGSIEKGMFKGDLYVTASNFQLKDAIVDGNIYFTNQAAKDTFVKDATSIVTGVQELKEEGKTIVKIGKAEYAAHGTKCFTVAVVAMAGDKIASAYIDDYQFMAKATSVAVPNSDKDFGLANYKDETKVLASKRMNAAAYSENMKNSGGATLTVDQNFGAIQDFVKGKTIAQLEAVAASNPTDPNVDAVSGATLVDTTGYLKAVVAAAKAARANTPFQVETASVSSLKVGKAEYAAHGTKCFTQSSVVMLGDKIVGAYLDDYQFMAKATSTAVPNSDKDFGTANYKDATKVLASKRVNAAAYSANMKTSGGATLTVDQNFGAVQAFVTGKTIAQLEGIANTNGTDPSVDAVTSATLTDTTGYLKSFVAAAKAVK